MRIGIIGNGAVGLMIAYRLSLKEDFRIDIFGDGTRAGAGSKAAGAMLVAFSEIEAEQFEDPALHTRFRLAERSLRDWPELLERIQSDTKADLSIQKGVKVIKSSVTTPYENEQLEYLKYVEELFPEDVQNSNEFIKLPTEMSFDARKYLKSLSSYLASKQNVTFINENPRFYFSGLTDTSCTLSWNSQSNSETYDHVIIAAGSGTRDILFSDKELFEGIPDVFYGIGTALIIEDVKQNNFVSQHGKTVVRTMNRGGACGYHLVNCNSYYYFGATNSIHHKPEFKPRVESLNNLTNYLKKEFSKDFELQLADYIVGFRPTTADTLPLLGGIKNNRIIFATGNKRDGLTCSPEVADEVEKIILGEKTQYDQFNPKRQLISYFDRQSAILKTAKSYCSGAYFHDLLDIKNWDNEVEAEVKNIEKIYKELARPPNFGIHPEMFNMFKYKRIRFY